MLAIFQHFYMDIRVLMFQQMPSSLRGFHPHWCIGLFFVVAVRALAAPKLIKWWLPFLSRLAHNTAAVFRREASTHHARAFNTAASVVAARSGLPEKRSASGTYFARW
jgi:hypothetical protein